MKVHRKMTKTSAITASDTSRRRRRIEERMAIRAVGAARMAVNTATIPAIPTGKNLPVDPCIHKGIFKLNSYY